MNNYCSQQWADLCERTRRSANHHVEFRSDDRDAIMNECNSFCKNHPPQSYSELLERTTQARDLAVGWMDGNEPTVGRQTTKKCESSPATGDDVGDHVLQHG